MAAPSRTVVVPLGGPQQLGLPAPGQPLPLPYKWADENLDYYVDFSARLAEVADAIVSATIACSPPGEISPETLSIAGGIVGFWTSNGLPGRRYLLKVEANTLAGRRLECLVQLGISALPTDPAPAPPVPAFGPPMTGTASPPLALVLSQPLTVALAALL